MKFNVIATFLIFSILVGCASTTYTHTADQKFQSKGDKCDFKVVSTLPKGDWEEIGVANITGDYNLFPDNPTAFKEKIEKDVCQAGGDLVVGEINGMGRYVRGTVFKKK